MTPSDWIAISSALVALAAVLLTGLAVFLQYRERRAAHRDYLFQRQCDAAYAILEALLEVNRHIMEPEINGVLLNIWDEDERQVLWDRVRSASLALTHCLQSHALVVPRSVGDSVVAYIELVWKLPTEILDLDFRDQVRDRAVVARERLAEFLGIETLQTDLSRILGVALDAPIATSAQRRR